MSFGQQNQVIRKTPTGRIDSAFLDGNDGSDVAPSWNATPPDLSQLAVGTAFSLDLIAAAFLNDPGSPASDLGFNYVSGQTAADAGFSFSGSTLSNPCTTAAIGTFRPVALRNNVSVLGPAITFVIKAAGPVVDSVAPTVPTGITAVPGPSPGTIAISFDAPCDIAPPNATASGVTHVDLLVNGTVASPPSPIATPTNALAQPTIVNVGSISSPTTPTVNQTGKAWQSTAAGSALVGTTSEQFIFADFGTLSGAQKLIALLDPYTTAGAANTAFSGIIIHETGAPGGRFIAIGLRPSDGTAPGLYVLGRTTTSGTSSQIATKLTDVNGQTITGPVYVKLERAADAKTLTVSYSLDQRNWLAVTTQTITMAASVHYGLALSSQSAGNQVTATIEEVALSNTPTINQTISSAVSVALQLRAVDANDNVSATSVAITGVPAVSRSQSIRWNPGHWTEANTVVKGSADVTTVIGQIDLMLNLQNIPGMMFLVAWGALQQQKGVYIRTLLDQLVNYITNRTPNSANKAKRWMVCIVPGGFSNTNPGSSSALVPAYIQQNVSLYGQSGYRVAGVTTTPANVSGWWGGDGNGNTYSAAIWRPNVGEEWIKVNEWLAGICEADPLCEGIYHIENSFMQGAGSTNGDGSYNDTNMENNGKAWLQRVAVAGPTLNVAYSNTFLKTQAPTSDLTNWMMTSTALGHPVNMGQTDSLGVKTGGSGHTGSTNARSWGAQAYIGTASPNIDFRPKRLFFAEIQAPDQGFFADVGAPREDILDGLNNLYHATHALWAIVARPATPAGSGTVPWPITWTSGPGVGATSATMITPWPLQSGAYTITFSGSGQTRTGNFTNGSASVTWSGALTIAQSANEQVTYPLTPGNWWNGSTGTAGADGLGAFLNDPANALTNTGYPPDYP